MSQTTGNFPVGCVRADDAGICNGGYVTVVVGAAGGRGVGRVGSSLRNRASRVQTKDKAEMKQLEPSTADADADIVMDAFQGAYMLESGGIRFFPDLPQALAAIGAEGFLLPYAKLAPYLSDKSEAREAWSAQAPP